MLSFSYLLANTFFIVIVKNVNYSIYLIKIVICILILYYAFILFYEQI